MNNMFLAKYTINNLVKLVQESEIKFYHSIKEKNSLLLGTNFVAQPPYWFLRVFPERVQVLRYEFLTNRNKYGDSEDFIHYIDYVINSLLNKVDQISWNPPYRISKEFNTTTSEFERSMLFMVDSNVSFAIMNLNDEELSNYILEKTQLELKRVLTLRRDLLFYYIDYAIKPFLLELLKIRGSASDTLYIEQSNAKRIFYELELRYRLHNPSKQRFIYLFNFLKDLGFEKRLDFLKTNSTYKNEVRMMFNETLTNFNKTHYILKQNKSKVDTKSYETYLNQKKCLEEIYEQVLIDFKIGPHLF